MDYSSLRNVLNGYSKNPSFFLKLINIIRRANNLELFNLSWKRLRIIINKLALNTYFNYYSGAPSIKFIGNILNKINKKIGFDSLFLLSKIYQEDIPCEEKDAEK